VARHRSPRDHRAQPLPPVHLRGPVGRARHPAVPVLLLGHAAVATTVAAGGTVAVAQGDPVPTIHENLLATSSVAEDGNGWESMEEMGSPTANHMGHVHISFDARPGGAGLASC
jgi:hypothetical protein